MHVAGDLGFRSLVLVACFLAPVIGFFVVRRKWRLANARREEIRRLLVLAKEEAARAEFEVTAGYGAASVAEIKGPYCVVCYCPTTTRCARCKAVRYCSGKCQIVHWRQGHKEECRPSTIVHQNIDVGSDSGLKVTKEDLETNTDKFQSRQSVEKSSEEPALPNPHCFPDVECIRDDDSEDEFLAERKGTNCTSDSAATSFSGFSTSASSTESSDDVSVSGSVSSFEPDRSDGQPSANDAFDIQQIPFNVNNIDQSKPSSPKFASLVDSVDGFAKLSKLNQVKPSINDEENVQRSNFSSGLNDSGMSECPVAESCTPSSDFWGNTLDSIGSKSDAQVSNSSVASNTKISDSGDSLHFSFNLSGSTAPPLHRLGSKSRGTRLGDDLLDSSELSKSTHGADLSEKISGDAVKVKNSPSRNSKGLKKEDNESSSNSHALKFREIKSMSSSSPSVQRSLGTERVSKSTDALNSSRVLSTSSERSGHAVKNCSRTSDVLKSREAGTPSPSVSDARLACAVGGALPRVKSGKVDCVEASDTVSSQATNLSNDRNGLKTSVFKVFDQFRGSKIPKHYPLGVGSEIAGKYSEKELFSYELFVKLYNWNKVELRPSGLINCGNSCYANAVLQCLSFTPPLTAYLLQGLHSKACVKKGWCFMCEFESLVLMAKEGNSPLPPMGILSQLRKIGSQLGNGREEDAHEFLRYAIDMMQSVCLTETGVNSSRSLNEETTLIGLTFGGYLRSKIKCTKCQGKSERQERMMDLTVEIEGDIGTLEEALRRFTGTETLDGENKYQCSSCKSYEKAKKKLTILEAPNILTIALKRFQSGKFGKISKPIRFPEILDLAPFMSGTSDKSPIYRLYGVVVHLDIMNAAFSGHYVCYVRNSHNKWFKVDDSTVTPVELEKVLTKGAYMLLYSRCLPRAPRLIRNRIISNDPKHRAIPSWIGGKATNLKPKSVSRLSTHSGVDHSVPNAYPPEELRRILEEDSSSDNSSLISNNSDESSYSTGSTRLSTSTDDLSDYIFGHSGRGWSRSWRNFSDSDTSSTSSSSPSSTKHSPLSDSNRYASVSPETIGSSKPVDSFGTATVTFLHSDTTKQCRKLASSSSSRNRETGTERLGPDSLGDVKFRKSIVEKER
ncbi:ubiquitin carboxyl-terminal hydrolase 16-like isoform X2 [Pyrus communis]|uniref:ubiquitin carboxyl-terminal hydrolase 16-like isoform X2 n=1 Tax=Pyrus communis TaxID=23211 RepID=UPI0035C11E6F